MICHQTRKGNHDARISQLKKVEYRYNYEGIDVPASYEGISAFEEISGVCICIYDVGSAGNTIIGQAGG